MRINETKEQATKRKQNTRVFFHISHPSFFLYSPSSFLAIPETSKVPEHKDVFLTATLKAGEALKNLMTVNMNLPSTRNEYSFVQNEVSLSDARNEVTNALTGKEQFRKNRKEREGKKGSEMSA